MSKANPLRKSSVLGLLFLAWIVAGSHCAIFAMAASHTEGTCCHKPDTGQHKACSECCQNLTALAPQVADAPIVFALSPLTILPEAFVLVSAPVFLLGSNSGRAPPPGDTFVECVLGSCLNSQAPPAWVS